MKQLINYQVINDPNGNPAFVFIPYQDFVRDQEYKLKENIPREVVNKTIAGVPLIRAWREHLKLTQVEMAQRMGLTQTGYSGIEASKNPRRTTLERVSAAMNVPIEQLES